MPHMQSFVINKIIDELEFYPSHNKRALHKHDEGGRVFIR